MGLDFNNSDVHFSYGGFQQFRKEIAATIGITLTNMEGFQDLLNPNSTQIKQVSWDSLSYDDIHLLLNHSDCDGKLTSEECAKVGKRLLELAERLESNSWYNEIAIKFANDLIKCAELNQEMEFC